MLKIAEKDGVPIMAPATPSGLAKWVLGLMEHVYLKLLPEKTHDDYCDEVVEEFMLNPSVDGEVLVAELERMSAAHIDKDSLIPQPFATITVDEVALTYITMMIACSFAAQAAWAEHGGEMDLAWIRVGQAQYWAGITQGADALADVIAATRADLASAGGRANKARYDPIREFVMKAVTEGNFRSKRNASIRLAPEVIAVARKNGINMSPDQAPRTIEGWLKKHPVFQKT